MGNFYSITIYNVLKIFLGKIQFHRLNLLPPKYFELLRPCLPLLFLGMEAQRERQSRFAPST